VDFRVGLLLFLASLGLFTSCARGKPEPPPDAPNVLLVIIDTLRFDKLGCYGNKLGLTPNIDALAKSGALFEQAISQAPWTLPSIASLYTSSYPERHGAGGYLGQQFTPLNDTVHPIAEILRDRGFDTAGIANVFFLSPTFHMDRGFENYDFIRPFNNLNERRATATTDAAIAKLKEKKDRTFFLMVHYVDPHMTYDPPAKFREKFAMPMDRVPDPNLFGKATDMRDLRTGRRSMASVPVERLERLYNGEIAYTDEQVGRLLAEVKALDLDKNTLVILTADHGEEFNDHGALEHGHSMYEEQLHVPLIMRYTSVIEPRRIGAVVRHIDVAPTILELAGLDPEPTFVGKSLAALLSKPGKDRPVFSQRNLWGPPLAGYRDEGYKVIQRLDDKKYEMYHLTVDPAEKVDLAGDSSIKTRSDRLVKEMDELVQSLRSGAAPPEYLNFSEEQKKLLGPYWGSEESGLDSTDKAASSRPASERPAN
jgi:arylsulfatase A-like enzyme